jgi:undecaprenyl diphosphate synthase
MKLFEEFAGAYLRDAEKEGLRIHHLGRKDRLSDSLCKKIKEYEDKTTSFENNTLNIALDYGGKDEIVRAINKLGKSGKSMSDISIDDVEEALDTAGQKYPHPDMIVRTGGERRMSGFMLWQGAYAEYFFTETLLPDLSPELIDEMLVEYANRQRRFGT